MTDRVRDDWARLASLAEVEDQHEAIAAGERLWAEIEQMRAELTITRAVLEQQTRKRDEARVELARRDTTIAAVRALCEGLQVESVTGGMTDAGSLWPSEVLELLSAPVEAGATEPTPDALADHASNDPRRQAARQELADALAAVDGDFDDRYLRMADALQSRYWTAEPTTED